MKESNLEGSGERALEANRQALAEARSQLDALEQRAQKGEIVDKEVRIVREKIDLLKKDQGKITEAGI